MRWWNRKNRSGLHFEDTFFTIFAYTLIQLAAQSQHWKFKCSANSAIYILMVNIGETILYIKNRTNLLLQMLKKLPEVQSAYKHKIYYLNYKGMKLE